MIEPIQSDQNIWKVLNSHGCVENKQTKKKVKRSLELQLRSGNYVFEKLFYE